MMLELEKIYYTSKGFDLLTSLENVTEYLHGIKL